VATGETLCALVPAQAVPFVAAPATRRDRNGHSVVRFADAAVKRAVFEDLLPRHYSGLGITVTIVWAAVSDTNVANRVRWRVAFERLAAGGHDLDADDFATAKTVDGAPAATAGITTYTGLAFTNAEIDGLLAGESFRLYLERVGTDGADTLTGEADLLGIELRET
jgi:hypothetical protein